MNKTRGVVIVLGSLAVLVKRTRRSVRMKMVMSVAGIIMLLFLYGCSSEVQDWEAAKLENTSAAYGAFLEQYPDGKHADLARARIEQEQILIHSVPGKLQIHLAAMDTSKTTLDNIGGEVKIYNTTSEKHYVMDESNLVGKSPIVLNDMQPGHYLIAVEPAEFHEGSANLRNPDPFMPMVQDPFLPMAAIVISVDLSAAGAVDRIMDGSTKVSGALIYLFEKKEGKRGIVTIHAQNSYSLSELEPEYPTGTNFTYDTTRINAQLEEANFLSLFDSTQMASTLDLLSRNGQVVTEKGDIRFLIDITDEQEYSVETWRKAKED